MASGPLQQVFKAKMELFANWTTTRQARPESLTISRPVHVQVVIVIRTEFLRKKQQCFLTVFQALHTSRAGRGEQGEKGWVFEHCAVHCFRVQFIGKIIGKTLFVALE